MISFGKQPYFCAYKLNNLIVNYVSSKLFAITKLHVDEKNENLQTKT